MQTHLYMIFLWTARPTIPILKLLNRQHPVPLLVPTLRLRLACLPTQIIWGQVRLALQQRFWMVTCTCMRYPSLMERKFRIASEFGWLFAPGDQMSALNSFRRLAATCHGPFNSFRSWVVQLSCIPPRPLIFLPFSVLIHITTRVQEVMYPQNQPRSIWLLFIHTGWRQ